MSKRPETSTKKPSGGRPLPRRLFSIDSLKKDRSNTGDSARRIPSHSRSRTTLLEKSVEEDPFEDSDATAWTEKPLVASPILENEPPSLIVEDPTPLDINNPSPAFSSDAAFAPPPSPSRRRWDTLRLHVLPSASSSVISVPLPSPPSDSSSIPTRPSTPKLPRFGYKKAFRQVVENVQTQQAGEHKRFTEAIRAACWNARFGEAMHHTKPEREGTLGSSLHLPFMASTASLQMPLSSSASTIQATNRSGGLKRPQSIQSLAQTGRIAPTVTHITRVLSSFSTAANRPQTLPHENLVLSALLLPFLDPREGTQVDMEQATAVEAFEYAVRTWKASSNEMELERCLWCCRAASVTSRSRLRVLGTLSSILFSRDRTFSADSPTIFQTLLQALFSLKYYLSLSPHSTAEMESLSGYISAIRSGSCGEISSSATEMEFGVRFSKSDSEDAVRDVLVTESVIRCLEVGDGMSRRWMLRNMLEEYWPIPEPKPSFTPLLACAHWRKLQAFTSSALSLLSQPSDEVYLDAEVMVTLFRTRIVAEVSAMRDEEAAEIRSKVVRLVLELLCLQGSNDREYVLMQFCEWYQHHEDWKKSIETAIQELVGLAEWPSVLRLIPSVMSLSPEEVQIPLISFVLPLINNRLTTDPPDLPCLPLTRFLDSLAQLYPKQFFKPLFTCAAANKDLTVVNQLCILNALSKFLPDLWLRDAEMMSVALMSDAMSVKTSSTDGPRGPRVGQGLLVLEILEQLHNVVDSRDLSMMSVATKFAVALETRLGLIIEAKEKSSLLPASQRLLFCSLFREIRLLTRSLKTASWLDSVVVWALQWPSDCPQGANPAEGPEDELSSSLYKLQAVYMQAREGTSGTSKRRNTALSVFSIEKKASERSDLSETSEDIYVPKLRRLTSILKARKAILLELFVAISALLTPEHYIRLGPMLWTDLTDGPYTSPVAPTCFLVMQFAEKLPEQFTALVEDDLSNVNPLARRKALEKLGILSTWRFQIMSQDVILDRTHRRPFKLQRPPVLFVATDIGSSLYVYEDDDDEYKDINGHVIPLELRRRLSEIGWAQEDRVVDHRLQRIRTPMTLLPNSQLERVDFDYEDSTTITDSQSPSPSPEPTPTRGNAGDTSLVRRESIMNGRSQGVRRRPVFVAPLVALFPTVASLVLDNDLFVSSTAQDVILDFMRDDPSLLSRTAFHMITGDEAGVIKAFTTLRAFLNIRHNLPPAMAHHILNHLTGFLKSSVRYTDTSHALRGYGYAVPIIAQLVTQVSKMSMREIRRAKVDIFLIPSGSLWFPPNAPIGPLFPRALEINNMVEDLPSPLVSITLVRTAQNILFLRMLKRNPQDIKVIRKTMTRLVLPSLSRTGDDAALTLVDLIPYRRDSTSETQKRANVALTALSLTLARSYLLLMEQVFQCMSRHLNDREELASLMDGLNRILITHGDDIGIVAHTMLALMTACTRFKRLFISGGYTLFMPAVMKIYVEAEYHSNIRYAIEYATSRFYALHQESFIFQTFDVMAQILSFPHADGPWVAGGVYALFTTLKGMKPTSLPDAAGIHDLNKAQEQEALMVTMAEEVPQTFLASFKRNGTSQEKNLVPVPLQEEYEGKRLHLDDLVRLFLTVVAHDSGIQRAEQFLKFLRLLTPYLHAASRSAQTVLRGGIDALGSILLTKSSVKPKSSEGAQARPGDEFHYQDFAHEKGAGAQLSAPSDLPAMRLEYLSLVLAFTGAGGQIGHVTTVRIIEMIKVVIKDANVATSQRVSTFLADYVKTVLIRIDHPPGVKEVITLLDALAPVASAYATKPGFDLSGVFEVLIQLSGNAVLTSEPTFARTLVSQYCRIGLDACELVASEDLLFSFPLRTTVVRLLQCMVPIAGADVMDQIDGRDPTHDFLSGIVLPMVLTLKTSADIMADSQWTEGWRREAYSKVWLRLLAYTLAACEKEGLGNSHRRSLSINTTDRQKAQGNRPFTKAAAPLMALSMALQVLKVIMIRAEEDISSSPELWHHIASLLKNLLADGDATFALRAKDYSEPPSPAYSPRVSTFQEQQQPLPSFPSSFSSHSRHSISPPRMIDYMTWSMIQWLWLRRSPLMIQMRIFVQERITNLATELRLQGSTPIIGGGSRSRPVSTIFSKPRRSMFGHSPASSAASTPRNSTFINTSISLPGVSDFSPSKGLSPSQPGRLAGFARQPSPISPSGRTSQDLNKHKIIHLGPVPPPETATGGPSRPVSIGSDPGVATKSARTLAKETAVRSPGLIRMTYRRIRLVQHLMGYSTLLPLNGSEYLTQDGFDAEVRVWSNRAAIEAVVDETKELMAEFKGNEGDLGDESMVYIDSQEFLLPSVSQESY